jgi:hypothetical protein
MSSIIGTVYCDKELCTWEVWTDGKAYSNKHLPIGAYRWPDGSWRTSPVEQALPPVKASAAIENLFSNYVAGIVVGPVDPLRHLRKK